MSKVIDAIGEALGKRLGDQNGMLDQHDVAIVLSQVRMRLDQGALLAEDETRKHPRGALIVIAVCAAVIGFWLRGVFGCR